MGEKQLYYKRYGVVSRLFRRTFSGEGMNVGTYMWAAQRITGLLLLMYLLLHLWTLSSALGGAESFNLSMEGLDHPLIKTLEVLLLCMVFFHCLNGARLILVNLFVDMNQKMLAYGMSAATFVLTIVSIPFVF